MRQSVERVIYANGTNVRIYTHNTYYDTRVLLQLVASKSWQNMERMIPSGGELLRGQYLLLCSPQVPIEAADTIVMDARTFVIRRVEPIKFRNKLLFYWGLCVEGGPREE